MLPGLTVQSPPHTRSSQSETTLCLRTSGDSEITTSQQSPLHPRMAMTQSSPPSKPKYVFLQLLLFGPVLPHGLSKTSPALRRQQRG